MNAHSHMNYVVGDAQLQFSEVILSGTARLSSRRSVQTYSSRGRFLLRLKQDRDC